MNEKLFNLYIPFYMEWKHRKVDEIAALWYFMNYLIISIEKTYNTKTFALFKISFITQGLNFKGHVNLAYGIYNHQPTDVFQSLSGF